MPCHFQAIANRWPLLQKTRQLHFGNSTLVKHNDVMVLFTAIFWEGVEWNIAFAIFCWWMWKFRNEYTFIKTLNNVSIPFLKRNILEIQMAFQRPCSLDWYKKEVLVSWECRPFSWWKLNTDGAVKGRIGMASCSGVFLDDHGDWVLGFGANLGIANVIEAELWGLFHGLTLAWQNNCRKVVVDGDDY